MSRQDTLRKVILSSAPLIQPRISFADSVALLGALAEVETNFGEYAVPKHETQFDWGGRYFRQDLWIKWGALAACSYSSFQLMFPVAVELGFDPNRNPYDLNDDEVAIHWVLEYINKRILDRGARTIAQFAACYNAGSLNAPFPAQYAQKFDFAYASVVSSRNLKQGGVAC